MVSEQSYGLLTFEPGTKATISQVDGDISEWKGKAPLSSSGGIELYVMSDEKFVYLMLRDNQGNVEKKKYYIGVDSVHFLGSTVYADEGVAFSRAADQVIVIDGKENSSLLIEASEDASYRYYSLLAMELSGANGLQREFPRNPNFEVRNSGLFNLWRVLISVDLTLPLTGEVAPISYYDAGKMLHGNSNPASADYTPQADFYISSKDNAIEMRIPWMFFNAADPSMKVFIGDLYASKDFNINPVKSRGIYFEVHRDANGVSTEPGIYTWDAWADSPTFHERIKESYYLIQKKFKEYPDV
jgi:hypothetical protein